MLMLTLVHIWSGVVPGVQHLGQNFNVVIVSGETFFAAASKYSDGIPSAEVKTNENMLRMN